MMIFQENEIPIPVRNDGKRSVEEYTYSDWKDKICEELNEVMTAESSDEKAEELCDIITVCTSFLEAIGYDLKGRKKLFRKINIKNDARGYFDHMYMGKTGRIAEDENA